MALYRTKKETIYEILKEEIYNGKYKAGERLIISRLAKRFDSSEIPVREALNQLSSEGLIEFVPYVGATVSLLSPKDIKNIFDVRIELEGLATRLAAENLQNTDFEMLREILDKSIASFSNKDYSGFEKCNLDFHMRLYEKSDNPRLVKIIESLWKNTKRYPSLFDQNDHFVRQSIEEHEQIYSALLEKNGLLAEELMRRHKERAGKEVIKLIEQKLRP